MAASITGPEPGRGSAQPKLDVLLVGEVPALHLADAVRRLFSSLVDVTVTLGDVKEAAALLEERAFHVVFLRMTSPTTAAGSLGFGKKKNTHFLFVFIIPENFKGCISEPGVDMTVTEPLTMEKLSIVVEYWKTYFSNTVSVKSEDPAVTPREACSQHLGCLSAPPLPRSDSLRNNVGLELKAPLSEFERSKKISLLHSSKEKLRRERIKRSCEQLRALVPGVRGRKNDAASVLEATVEYMEHVRDRIPAAVMGQITAALQSNRSFCKKRAPAQLPLPATVTAPRESSTWASPPSPERGVGVLANRCPTVYPAPAPGDPTDRAARGTPSEGAMHTVWSASLVDEGPSGGPPEQAVGDMAAGRVPSPAPARGPFRAIRSCPTAVPSWEVAAVATPSATGPVPTMSGPRVSKWLPVHCGSGLGQAASAPPDRLQQFGAFP